MKRININYVKFSLDVIMAILFVLFFNKNVLGGLAFHEIAGLFFAGAYFTHILLNLSWVKRTTLKLFDRNLSWRMRGSYLLNLLLLILTSYIIISGILISHVVFSFNVRNAGGVNFVHTHISISFLVLALTGIHIGLHWQWVVGIWKKITRFKHRHTWIGYAAKGITGIILLFGLYEANQTSFFTHLKDSVLLTGTADSQRQQSVEEGKQAAATSDTGSQVTVGNPSSEAANSGDGQNRHSAEQVSVNVFMVIATYTGIMAIFVILTYYLKKTTIRRKKKRTLQKQMRGAS